MNNAAAGTRNRYRFFPLLISIIITLSIGFTASLFTRPEIAGWYQRIIKPSFTPPGWLFGPVWGLLYIMMAAAAWLIWQQRKTSLFYPCCRAAYFVQLLLNFLWSFTFFGLHQINLGLFIIIALLAGIVVNMYYFNKISKTAAWLLAPYLLWVSFASTLNIAIYYLNR